MSRQVLKAVSEDTIVSPEKEENQTLSLDNIPEDIYYLILSDLVDSSPSSLRSVSQSSKTLHDAALPLMYRNLKLSRPRKGSGEMAAYKALLEKFRGASASDIARNVRSITVENEIPCEDLMLILAKIAEFGRLHELNWNTSARIPKPVLERLSSTWPNLELSAKVVERMDPELQTHSQMDSKLLSSSLLTRLTYVVYDQGYRRGTPSRSEWPKLSQALLPGKNLRYLSIATQEDNRDARGETAVSDREPEKLPRLDLSLGANFSKLEHLSIRNRGYSTYLWDGEHCRTLRDSINPSRLRTLNFGDDNPEAFFSTFTGYLPNLTSLRFGVRMDTSIEPARDFIDSLSSLESLHIGAAQKGIDQLLPVIEKHRETLKTLVFGPTLGQYCIPEYIDRSVLENITKTFPKIENLGWHIPFKQVSDEDFHATLSTMQLRKLDIFMHIPDGASEYSEALNVNVEHGSNQPPLNRLKSIAAATRIAESISKRQTEPLKQLTLHIGRTLYMDRFQPYMTYTGFQLRRNESSTVAGENYHVRGTMDWWHGPQSLKEELSFQGDEST